MSFACLALLASMAASHASEVAFPAGTRLAVPAGAQVDVQWVVAPGTGAKDLPTALAWSVDGAGESWLAYDDRSLLNPGAGVLLRSDARFLDFAWLQSGEVVVCTPDALGTLESTGARAGEGVPVPTLHFRPVYSLPPGRYRIFPGTADAIYLVAKSTGSDRVHLIRRDKGKGEPPTVAGLISIPGGVSAVAGDGESTLIAAGRRILRLSHGKVEVLFAHPKEAIRALAHSFEHGTFYATERAVGVLRGGKAAEFLETPKADLRMAGGALFVFLTSDRAILSLRNLSGLGALFVESAAIPADVKLRLPDRAASGVRWAVPPSSGFAESLRGFRLDRDGSAWYGLPQGLLFNRSTLEGFEVPSGFGDFAWLEKGELVFCTEKELAVVEGTRRPREGEAAVFPLLKTRPLLKQPFRDCRLSPGRGDSLFVSGSEDGKSWKVFELQAVSFRGAEVTARLVAEMPERVAAVVGNGRSLYIASGRAIVRNGAEPVFLHPTERIEGLALGEDGTLFYATSREAGLVRDGRALAFLEMDEPQIQARDGELYVALQRGGAVLAIPGLTAPVEMAAVKSHESPRRITRPAP